MGEFLEEDLNPRWHPPMLPAAYVDAGFDYRDNAGIPSGDRRNLKRLSGYLAEYVKGRIAVVKAQAPDTPLEVTIVAHSMGGLLVRTWMAGLALKPRFLAEPEVYGKEVDRLVMAGTPNFGTAVTSDAALGLDGFFCEDNNQSVVREQNHQMLFGSDFLKSLNELWQNQISVSVFPERIMTIVGCAPSLTGPGEPCKSDIIVDNASATLPRQSPDYQIRYVRRRHFGGLVYVTDDDHPTFRLIRDFILTGSSTQETEFLGTSKVWPIVIHGLIVAPLIDAKGKPVTDDKIVFGQIGSYPSFDLVLPSCDNPFLAAPVNQANPQDKTGWWTLRHVAGGCWMEIVKGKKGTNSQEVDSVQAGRPFIADAMQLIP